MATRDDIIENLQAELAEAGREGTSKKDCGIALDAVLKAVAKTALEGESVRTVIGTFRRRDTEARTGRNPSNGDALEIPAKTTLAFKAASAYNTVKDEPKKAAKPAKTAKKPVKGKK